MNERQAEQAGYTFTGIYERSHNKEEVKRQAEELRKLGNKAITVYSPDSKLSRGGGGGGYSVYWIESEVNKAIRLEQERQSTIGRLMDQRLKLLEDLSNLDIQIANLREESKNA